METVIALIETYGFPAVAALGFGYMVYGVWRWSTEEVQPAIEETNQELVALIDRIRMLDNDLIRLTEKVNVATELLQRAELALKKNNNKGDPQ